MDPEKLTHLTLHALKSLQNDMENLESISNHTTAINLTGKEQSSIEILEVDAYKTEIVKVVDKLYPEKDVCHVIETQTVQRSRRHYFVCDYCAKEFAKLYCFIRHSRTHTGENPFGCDNCIKSFKTLSKLREHKQRMHKGKENTNYIIEAPTRFDCNECNYNFTTLAALKTHKRREHDKELEMLETYLPEPICEQQPENISPIYKCVYCDETFGRRYHCQRHMRSHLRHLLDIGEKNTEDTKKPCITTSNKFQTVLPALDCPVVNVINEDKIVHSKENYIVTQKSQPISNTDCSVDLIVHHVPRGQNNCMFCEKSFKRFNDLRCHIRTHTQEKPYECSTCRKRFAQQSTLSYHMGTHKATRPTFRCQVCGKPYASKSALTVHLRLHTNAKPFQCDYCPQRFRTSGHKLAHIKAAKHNAKIIALQMTSNFDI